MSRSFLPLRLLSFLALALPAITGCDSFLDLGRNDEGDNPKAQGTAPPKTPGPGETGGGAKTPKVECGAIAPGVTELYRSPGSENFNVMGMTSDGIHVYLAGHAPLSTTSAPVPDAANPMKTATILRIPVGGGAREVIDFEHGAVSRGVVVDKDNIYWASDLDDAVLMRPKAGGAVTPFALPGNAGIPQSVATDGAGNVFWTTWHGSSASSSNPIAALGKRAAGTTTAATFQESHGEEDGAQWVTADATNVYWLAGRDALELRSAPIGGGTHTVLASGIEQGYRITSDDDHVWGVSNKNAWKVPKKGGERVIVTNAKPKRDFRSIAVSADAIYLTDDMAFGESGTVVKGPIYKANKDGSNLQAITGDVDSTRNITTDDCRVFWVGLDWVGNPGYELVIYSRAL